MLFILLLIPVLHWLSLYPVGCWLSFLWCRAPKSSALRTSIVTVRLKGFIKVEVFLFDAPFRGLVIIAVSVRVCALVRLIPLRETGLSFACNKVSGEHVGRGNLRFFSSSLLKPSPAARLLRLDLPVEERVVLRAVEGTCFAAGGVST